MRGEKQSLPFLFAGLMGEWIGMSLRPETSSGENGTDVSTFPGGMILDKIMPYILQNNFRSFPN